VKYSGFKINYLKKSYGNSARVAIIAALPGYKKQTLKSQMRNRLLIIKLGAAWCCLMGSTIITFFSSFVYKEKKA